LVAPIRYPGTLFRAGANYWDHFRKIARRTTGKTPSMAKPPEPRFFLKTAAASIIDTAPIPLPSFSRQVDWEAELGVVIGRVARDLPESRGFEAVAGYVIVNDLSARDLMKREGTPFVYDWVGQKCFHDAACMSPWLTPAAYVPDPGQMGTKLWVNAELKQDSNTSRCAWHRRADRLSRPPHRAAAGRRDRRRHAGRSWKSGLRSPVAGSSSIPWSAADALHFLAAA
jgi:2-keto-4-pentenoate hydratase/2-oxohepta-3-ene-1,7-dioic acid hydratase in catechol pathway